MDSKQKDPNNPFWPDAITNIQSKNKKKQKKCDFRKSSKKFYIDINKRLYQTRTIISLFEGQQYIINSLILLEIEIEPIVNLFHIKLGHLGINVLMYEIERRGLYINRLLEYCKKIIKNCKICIVHKLNKYTKKYPDN